MEWGLYARRPGAFVDLAADLSWLGGDGLSSVPLDDALGVDLDSSPTGLAQASTINQAIGILIERGFNPAEARGELDDLAARSHRDLSTAAQSVVDAVTDPRRLPTVC
jgi:hypothetical protein